MFILALGLAKWSVNACVLALTPSSTHRRIGFVLGAVITLWTVTSFLATAFQCGSQGPWNRTGSECFNQVSIEPPRYLNQKTRKQKTKNREEEKRGQVAPRPLPSIFFSFHFVDSSALLLSISDLSQRAFYHYVGIANILTDVALIALPVAIIWPLRMPWTSLASAMGSFASRILSVKTPNFLPR